jgi:hypothetical protein
MTTYKGYIGHTPCTPGTLRRRRSKYQPYHTSFIADKREHSKSTYRPDRAHDSATISMTPDRKFHAAEGIWADAEFKGRDAFWHLLKLFEILEAVKMGEKLRKLRIIVLQLHTLCWGENLSTGIRSTIEGTILSVDWSGLTFEFHHPSYARS